MNSECSQRYSGSPNLRRAFIGGSDARIIMGADETALLRLWREKRGEAEPEDLSGNLIVQLGRVTEDLNRHWFERNTGRWSPMSRGGSSIPWSAIWRPPSMAWLKGPGRCLKPSSCCLGASPRKPRPKSTCRSCSTTCGSPMQGLGALDHHRRRQMGRDHPFRRSALPAPAAHGGKEVLALCRDWRAAPPVRHRATAASD